MRRVLLAALASCLPLACGQPPASQAPAAATTGVVRVALVVEVPPPGLTTLRLRLQRAGEGGRVVERLADVGDGEALFLVSGLEPGEWLVLLEGRDARGQTLLCGVATTWVRVGLVTSVGVLLVPAGGCEPVELLCADGVDEDGDGERDCADPDCGGRPCDDGDPCTRGETCAAGVCGGGADACVTECGNGEVEEGEGCDDGGESEGCDADCTPAECGDGVVNATAGEGCDDAGGSAVCTAGCAPVRCWGWDADCGPAAFCARAAGACDGAGTCAWRPEDCPPVVAPVCGCDGETWDSDCLAAQAGTGVDLEGACLVVEPPVHVWSAALAGPDPNQFGRDVAVDADGNVFVVGGFEGRLELDDHVLDAQGLSDVFVASFTPDGALRWLHRYGDASRQTGDAVAVDGAGDVYVAGGFAGTISFGPGEAQHSAGVLDVFVVKLDTDGDPVWSRGYGDADWQYAHALATDSQGCVYLTGELEGTVDFGGEPLSAVRGTDVYLVKLDAAGAHVWSQRYGGQGRMQSGDALAVGGDDEVYLAGTFEGDLDLGGGLIGNAGLYDVFVARLGPGGGHVWSASFGDDDDQELGDVHVDDAGAVYVTGSFAGGLTFPPAAALAAAGGMDVFLARLDPATGAGVWARGFGDGRHQFGRAVASDGAGSVLLAGSFSGSLRFGEEDLFAWGAASDAFFAALDADGEAQWSAAFGSNGDDGIAAVAASGPGALYVTGWFEDWLSLSPDAPGLPGQGETDVFVARMAGAP